MRRLRKVTGPELKIGILRQTKVTPEEFMDVL